MYEKFIKPSLIYANKLIAGENNTKELTTLYEEIQIELKNRGQKIQ
jgi:hypothetical protein